MKKEPGVWKQRKKTPGRRNSKDAEKGRTSQLVVQIRANIGAQLVQ